MSLAAAFGNGSSCTIYNKLLCTQKQTNTDKLESLCFILHERLHLFQLSSLSKTLGWEFFLGMLGRWVYISSVTVGKVYLDFGYRIFRHAHVFCTFESILGSASFPVFVYLPPPQKIVFWLYSTGS